AAGFVGLGEEILEKSPFDLSGGQKRRVAIAGVIAMRPEVLILDEPTAGLDPGGREELMENILRYHDGGKRTVIYITHSMEDAARTAQRIVVFNQGHIAMDGTPREVFRRGFELIQMGIIVPQITRVMMRLRELGLDVDDSVYSVDQAMAALRETKGGGDHA
ncbi:MAG: ATP-binding cassette domain-containing protein, partial [Oscillospiraceae bacterium]|nr:ATP-binding cassette domain-containing protein [Oscillospiraceae bacterium]